MTFIVPEKEPVETVTIPKKEYETLKKDQSKLIALENGGVDNWDGYEFAMEEMDKWEKEDEQRDMESSADSSN